MLGPESDCGVQSADQVASTLEVDSKAEGVVGTGLEGRDGGQVSGDALSHPIHVHGAKMVIQWSLMICLPVHKSCDGICGASIQWSIK